MRREQIQKICLNHALTNDVEYTVKDPKSWQFVVNDFSEGAFELDHFSIRFKTDEIAKQFKQAIDDALAGKLQTIQNGDSHATELENLTAEERQSIVDLKLPNDFYKYKNHEQCSGCRGCNSDEFVFSEVKDTNCGQFDDNPLPLVMPAKQNDIFKGTSQAAHPFPMQAPSAESGLSGGTLFGGNSFKSISSFDDATTNNPLASSFSFGPNSNSFANIMPGSFFGPPPQSTQGMQNRSQK